HNGIIENYDSLKKELINRGYVFESDTDTEVLIYLIEDIQKNEQVDLYEAVRIALNQVIGAYAIVIVSKKEPDVLVAARKGSPLVIGVGEGEYYIASDASPIIEYTKKVVYLDEEEVALVKLNEHLKIKTIKNQDKTPYIEKLEMNLSELEKEGFEHFMLKEIYEQPRSIRDSFRGRLILEQGIVNMGGVNEYEQKLLNAKRIIIIACGTSWHAGLVGEYLIEDLARIPVEVEYASEFRYRNPMIGPDDVVLAISQSGETADTLAAIQLAREAGALVLGICNVAGSSISRETHAGVYTHAGIEIGVASTKAFTAQVTVLTMMAIMIGKEKGLLSEQRFSQLIKELYAVPAKIEKILELNDEFKRIAEIYKDASNALYLGRGVSFP
ncbi:MAG: glutamine--fructose-6-phosphate transaminase (isomerizing), partial [Bacteroidales bacterium]|nr:glutamine--fructose-6-phosphate transaminase (isomerizing) [Bacteroidales bacterium]